MSIEEFSSVNDKLEKGMQKKKEWCVLNWKEESVLLVQENCLICFC